MGDGKRDGVELRVTYGPLPRPPFKVWLKNGLARWWREMPFLVVGRLGKAATDWKSIAAGVVFLFFLVPPLYRSAVRWTFPHSYYYLGSLANPPEGFNDLPEWQVDMNWIDNASKDVRWDRFVRASGQIAYIKEKSYIPGRELASGISDEAPGKVWTGKQCLFIDGVAFVGMDVKGVDDNGDGKSDEKEIEESLHHLPDGELLQVHTWNRSLREISEDKRGDALKGFFERKGLGWSANTCPTSGFGPRCPRVAVWAYGAPAPCSIWPF